MRLFPTQTPFSSANVRMTVGALGSLLITLALVIIWGARISIGKDVYVSALGAAGESTAAWFEISLLMLVLGALLIAWNARFLRSGPRLLARWAPSVTLLASALLFLVASQVPCTTGCPLPVGDSFTWQDLVHTVAAVLAFAAAGYTMIQIAFTTTPSSLKTLSMAAGLATAAIAATGGILSLLRLRTDIGSLLELTATTVGMTWLIALGLSTAFWRT